MLYHFSQMWIIIIAIILIIIAIIVGRSLIWPSIMILQIFPFSYCHHYIKEGREEALNPITIILLLNILHNDILANSPLFS